MELLSRLSLSDSRLRLDSTLALPKSPQLKMRLQQHNRSLTSPEGPT